MQKKVRNPFVDNLKAIGIISIVIGHSSWKLPMTRFPIGPFVYTYHLMIFFFVAGWCFKKEKAEKPWDSLGSRLKNYVPLFVGYGTVYVLLHNLFRSLHMISSTKDVYDISKMIYYIASSFTLTTAETLLSALWFVPVLFLANGFFFLIFSFSERQKHPVAVRCMGILLIACIGIFINEAEINLNYHMQTVFLAVPALYAGYVAKCYRERISRYVTWYGTILAGLVLYGVLRLDIGMIELAKNQIIHPLLFYPVTAVGIYFCSGLAKGIGKSKELNRLFTWIGRNSFHIMALHFTAIKLVDVIYGTLTHAEPEVMETFPYAFQIWPVYYVAGIFLPLFVVEIGRKLLKIAGRQRENAGFQ